MSHESIYSIKDLENTCLAIVIKSNFSPTETTFYSEAQYSQQIGIIKYAKGGEIKPHFHNEISREVIYTQEVLVIRKGSVRVKIYDKNLRLVQFITLFQNDVIFLVSGGHGFEMLEDCEMLEVKQGPYNGVSNDKTHFKSE